VAILVVLFFWGDFQIHATDIYLRYVTTDIELWMEMDEIAAEKEWHDIADKIIKFEKDARLMLGAKLNKFEEQIARKTALQEGTSQPQLKPRF
jgi:hypothetical protein